MAIDLPWMKFMVLDYLNDPELSRCSEAARGLWVDALCRMHLDGRRGVIACTLHELAAMCRCDFRRIRGLVEELREKNAAEVRFVNRGGNEIVTLINRRMKREFEKRQMTNARVVKHRETHLKRSRNAKRNAHGNDFVTGESQSQSQNTPLPPQAGGSNGSAKNGRRNPLIRACQKSGVEIRGRDLPEKLPPGAVHLLAKFGGLCAVAGKQVAGPVSFSPHFVTLAGPDGEKFEVDESELLTASMEVNP